MEVKLEEYVYGGCTDEERNAVRCYIMADFYNAFDVIEMMRDRAYEELSPSRMRMPESADLKNMIVQADACMFERESIVLPSFKCSIPSHSEPQRPRSILALLNNYLAKD